jgi:tripartite-type tricarboxylate transporter receptor subunit TctC
MKPMRLIITALMLGCMAAASNPAAAQSPSNADSLRYPERSIRFIVPFAPGGATDIVARVVGAKLSEAWDRPVVIDNRPGAGGNIAAEAAAKASPDGYTVLVVADAGRVKGLYNTLNYNIVEDFSPITLGTVTPLIVVTHPTLPVRTIHDLLALAKERPLLFGSGGIGSSTEIAGLLFNAMGHVHLEEVTYKSIPPALPDLLAGRLAVAFLPVQLAAPLVASGELKALAVTSADRSSAWPDLPTVAEAGLPGYEHNTWAGFVVRAGTPPPIVAKLNTEMVRILGLPDVRERLASQGSSIGGTTPEEFGRLIKDDIEKQRELVRTLGLRLN